jgi:hypothetical protein
MLNEINRAVPAVLGFNYPRVFAAVEYQRQNNQRK